MAQALKCDRCGKLFEREDIKGRCILGKPGIVFRQSCNVHASDNYLMDICNSCWKEFQDWWYVATEDEEEEDE